MRKLVFFITILVLTFAQGCVKTTLDLDKISGKVALEPSFVIAAVKGDVTLGDIVESNDTLFFDNLGLMKLFFKEDSIINYGVNDFYNSFPAGSYTELYPVTPTLEVAVDTLLDIDPGTGIQIKEMSVVTGNVGYTITSTCSFNTMLRIEFPSIDDGGSPLVDTIRITGAETVSGNIDISDVLADFTSDPLSPYNRLPISFKIIPGGIASDSPGTVNIDVTMDEPEFDYVKGFFGNQTELSEEESIDLGMEEFFSKISGSFGLANPIIRVNYKNSFGLPLRIEANVTGKNSSQEIDLNRAPEDLLYPSTLTTRDVESSFVIDNSNSDLPDLISMLPNSIIFSGSATTNPNGDTGADNLIFGNSRFMADIEVEVPMELWINNLQLTDTIDNFLLGEDSEESILDILSDLELRLFVDNGFPLGGSISITLFDSVANNNLSVISTDTFFEPASVDSNGRVSSSTEKSTVIEMSNDFIEDAEIADKMIISFTLFTPGGATQDVVKIYSDYSIIFKAGIAFKADLN